jgi:NAD(P)H-hydrate repair Nnr-like enzyme with NAD(P)H-hydrate dehydratase domain
VHVHGLAGDTLSRTRGELGLAASDLIDELPAALLSVRSAR